MRGASATYNFMARSVMHSALRLMLAWTVAMFALVLPAPAWAAPEADSTSSESAAEVAGEAGGAAAGEVAAAAADATSEAEDNGIILPGGSTNAVDPRQTPDNSFLYDTSIVELTHADSSYQGNIVQVTGEVIGDAIRAEEDPGKHWITLESLEEGSANSISALIDDSYLGLIDTYGAYGRIGTTLQIRGVFHLTCTSHEGIMDIHADTVKLVSPGVTTSHAFNIDEFTPGIAFVVLGLVLVLLYRHLREKER